MRAFRLKGFLPAAFLATMLLQGCSDEGKPVKGFVLPEGDITRGEQLFVEYNCYHCHSIPGKEFPEREFEPPFTISIGGEVYRVRNYGELMTAVVNPDHIISPKYLVKLEQDRRDVEISPMPDFSDEMTISEMRDLVEFLHAQYTRLQPQQYRGYYLVK